MKRFLAVVGLSALVVAGIAIAAPKQVGGIAGPGALHACYTGQKGGQYLLQCSTAVYFRPSCSTRADAGVTCVNDAGAAVDGGPGDLIIDFSNSKDPYPIPLGTNEDKICARTTSGAALSCSVFTP